jgi:hypothetical protein
MLDILPEEVGGHLLKTVFLHLVDLAAPVVPVSL